MHKITPFLWFDGNAEEAVNFYVATFKNSRIESVARDAQGAMFSATFQIEGQEFMVLNGGPQFTFSPAISFFVNCETQEEVDELWEKLSEDKFGVSWQIIPSALGEMLQDDDPGRSKRVMDAMLTMDKIDIEGLRRAYEHG